MALGALIAVGAMVAPASAAITAGTWVQYPNGTTTYEAQVQQPINTANTSNWNSKSKGAIPVMFKLSSGTGSAVFQSKDSDNGTPVLPPYTGTGPCGYGTAPINLNDCAYMSFTPDSTMKFSDVTDLTATYKFLQGNCGGGSLRWSLSLDVTGDGNADGSAWVYYGDTATSWTNCTGASSQTTVNMMTLTDARWDNGQLATFGGTYGQTLAQTKALFDNATVLHATLAVDGGWSQAGLDQVLDAGTTATVNGNTYTWNAGGTGIVSPTCVLPAATIEINKLTDPGSGAINEEPVQASLVDGGNAFRTVDCKYQYVLSIPSLHGTGNYRVEILIDNVSVPTPGSPGGMVKFDLK